MRIACIQMRSTVSPAENLAYLETMVAEAAQKGAVYIQTPEMTSIIDKNPKALLSKIESDTDKDHPNSIIALASRLAKQHKIWLHLGSVAIKIANDKVANRAMLFSPQGIQTAIYDKIHMFDVDLPNGESWRESALYQPGNEAIIVETSDFTLGLAICYDLRFPHLFRQHAQKGAQILTCPAAFTKQTGEAHWHTLLRARAIENGAFMIAAAQGGTHEDGRQTYGHSIVIDPWGKTIAELDHDAPGLLIADIDLTQVDATRTRIPSLNNGRTFTTRVCGPRLRAQQ